MAWRLAAVLAVVAALLASDGEASDSELLRWDELSPLPGTPGLGGPFVGVHRGALIVAGGANFPDAAAWDGGKKVWHHDVYVLERDASEWRTGFSLERPLAYGASISTDDGVVLLGGCDSERCYDDVRLLRWDPTARAIQVDELPPLPEPTAFPAAARIGSVIYVAAGQRTVEPDSLVHAFWALDLARPSVERRWESLPPWPGPPRIKAVAAAQSAGGGRRCVYLFSGEMPERDAGGALTLRYLTDAYRFDPHSESSDTAWTAVASMVRPVAAACALDVGPSHVLVFSGSTGRHVTKPVQQRPEFPAEVLAYHTITDTWAPAGPMPKGVVTTSAARLGDRIVIPSGETRPGVRSPAVRTVTVAPPRSSFGSVNTAVLVVYLLLLVLMGVYFSRRERTTDDFFVAGRRIPWWAAGLSIYATQLSAITFLAMPAVAFATDWIVFPGSIMILAMAPLVIRYYLPFFRRLEITTAYEYLEARFDLAVRLFGSASFIVFQLGRMAVVVYLPALALAAITGIDVYVCILILGVLATLYTVLGGIEAVIWTDVIQVIVLWGGLLVALAIVFAEEGGPGPVFGAALEAGKLRLWNGSMSFTELASWSILIGTFALQFGPYTTDQSVIQRYMTTPDETAAARGIWLNGLLAVPFLFFFFAMGTCLWVFFRSHPDILTVGMQNDQIFPLFVARKLPVGVSGLVIAGIFAASMSSLDSSVHSISTAVTTDFYRRFRPEASDRSCLRLARWIIVILGVVTVAVASALATFDIRSLFFFFQGLLGLVSSGLVGVFILGVFTKRATATGALVGAAAGTGLLVYVSFFAAIQFYLYAVLGIGTCVLVGYVASILVPGRKQPLSGLTIHTQRGKRWNDSPD